jgi:hypothetical protein
MHLNVGACAGMPAPRIAITAALLEAFMMLACVMIWTSWMMCIKLVASRFGFRSGVISGSCSLLLLQ